MSPRAGTVLHLITVAVLATIAVHVILRRAGLVNAFASVVASVALGVTFTLAYARLTAVAIWTRYTAILPVLAVVTFLFLSPASDAFSATASSGGSARGGNGASVVFLVLDEFPTLSLIDEQDQIDADRFPNLAAFAQDSTWYRRHSTVATSTRQAVPAILTGEIPSGDEALMVHHPNNLFALLRSTHEMRVSESRTWLCGFADCRGSVTEGASLDRQLRTMVRGAGDLWGEQVMPGAWEESQLDDFEEDLVAPTDQAARPDTVDAPVVSAPSRFVDFLDSIEPTGHPTLWYQHLLMPHQPWHLYPDGQEYTDPEPPALGGAWAKATTEQRHLFQAQYADHLVGELMARVEAAGLYDDSLIVVVADHGISFERGANQRRYTEESAEGVAFSPLLIKAPGQTDGVVDDKPVMSLDILPTVADLLGIDVPWDVDGLVASSSEVEGRGTTRVIYDFGSFNDPEPRETFAFDDTVHFPSAEHRWIRDVGPDEPPLIGLAEVVDSGQWLGQSLDDLTTTNDGSVAVAHLDSVERAGTDPRPGFVDGSVDGVDGPGRVLVAIDGVVVSAAPVADDDGALRFRAMLPPGIDPQADVEVRVAWVPRAEGTDASGMVELAVDR